MKRRSKRIVARIAIILVLISAYPLFVLLYTWTYVIRSDLPGGRHGPRDAYRHTLASAVVAYTLDDSVVEFVTRLMEGGGRDSNSMDSHNNTIGAAIGSRAASFAEIEPTVYAYVSKGSVNATSEDQVVWLPEKRWSKGFAW